MFSGRPSVRPFSFNTYSRDAISLYLVNETCHRYSSCEWKQLKRFPRSEVKGQGQGELYNGGGIHFDGVASRLTCCSNRHRHHHHHHHHHHNSRMHLLEVIFHYRHDLTMCEQDKISLKHLWHKYHLVSSTRCQCLWYDYIRSTQMKFVFDFSLLHIATHLILIEYQPPLGFSSTV